MRSIAWKFVIGAAAVVGLAASVVAASVRKSPDAAEVNAPQASEEPVQLAMLETTASAKPAPVDVLQPTEPNTSDAKPIVLLGLDGWESQNMEQPFVNMARMLGNSWGAGQNWPGNESMDMSALWKGGFIDPDTMLPKAVPPGMDLENLLQMTLRPRWAAAMLRTGIGIGLLPTFMEAAHPELVAVSEPIPELAAPIWMLTHPDLRQTARVRAFMQHVGDALAEHLRAI